MINIEESLRRAVALASAWKPDDAFQIATDMADPSSATIDWDKDAGESWLRIVDRSRVIALVSVVIPFAFVHGEIDIPSEHRHEVVSVIVDDFDSDDIVCKQSVLREAFGEMAGLETLGVEGFSVNDLWYVTV